MKRVVWIFIAFFIVVILVAAEAVIISDASGSEARERVVYASVHIDRNTVITPDMLVFREINTGDVHPYAIKDKEAAVSKRAVMDVEAGEMLLDTKLTSSKRTDIEAEDKTKRLFSLKLEGDQANGWQLAEGQMVDIIYVPNNSEGPGGVQMLKNIRVAGMIRENGEVAEESRSKSIPRYVSFEVTEEQAGFLAYAKSNGKLELSCIPE